MTRETEDTEVCHWCRRPEDEHPVDIDAAPHAMVSCNSFAPEGWNDV